MLDAKNIGDTYSREGGGDCGRTESEVLGMWALMGGF